MVNAVVFNRYIFRMMFSSAIRQKGESQNGGNKKAKHAKFSFFRKFGVLCFLVTSVLRFALLSYYRQYVSWFTYQLFKTMR